MQRIYTDVMLLKQSSHRQRFTFISPGQESRGIPTAKIQYVKTAQTSSSKTFSFNMYYYRETYLRIDLRSDGFLRVELQHMRPVSLK